MKVKFEYERTAKKISWFQFREELKSFCDFMLTESYHGPVMDKVDKLYKDRFFVALIHKWHELDMKANAAESGSFWEDSYMQDRDHIAWILVDLL